MVLDGFENIDFSKLVNTNMLFEKTVGNAAIVVNKEAKKENALEDIVDYYNLSMEEVLSFGDDFVDLEMIKRSGCRVAMANGLQEIKDAADYITLSNDEDGVAHYLEKFILN